MFKISSFLPFIKLLAPFFTFGIFFAAGADALGAMGGDAGAVVLDTGGEEESAGAEGEGEGAGAGEGEGEGEGNETAKAAGADKPGPEMAKPLSGAAKTALKALKESQPEAWKEINKRLWALNGIDQKIGEHFENGIEGAIELKSTVDNFLTEAGARDFQEVRTELNDFRNTDAKLIKGDPSVISDLPENVQAGIYKMMPHFVSDWGARDKDGHDRYFANLVVNTLRDTDFTYNLQTAIREVERMGLDNPEVKTIHDLLTGNMGWINKLKTQATTQPEKKAAVADDQQVSTREQKVRQEELKLSRTRVGSSFRSFADPKMSTILKGLHGGKVPGNVNKGEVFLKALNNLAVTLGQQFSDQINRYLEAGDEAGAIKYMQSQTTEKRLSDAVEKANTYLYGKAALGGRRPAPGGDKDKDKDKNNPGQRGGDKTNQFTTIAYNPKTSSIDMLKSAELAKKLGMTRNQLFSQSKAVLKSGKLVTWPRDAESEA